MPPSTPPQMPHKPSQLYLLQPPNNTIKPMKPGNLALSPPPELGRGTRYPGLLRRHRRTNPLVWCGAVLCIIFSLLLILAGIITLIIFLVIKPKNPLFDTPVASLNSIYLDSPAYLNGDLTFLANFTNPNQKIDVQFDYVSIELYFFDRLIATQALQPFVQRRGEARLEAVHMISSQVYLPPDLLMELQKQVRSNRVVYNIRGTFKVKASVGPGHLSYWLYGRCQVELTGPPSGVLMARNCKTKK